MLHHARSDMEIGFGILPVYHVDSHNNQRTSVLNSDHVTHIVLLAQEVEEMRVVLEGVFRTLNLMAFTILIIIIRNLS